MNADGTGAIRLTTDIRNDGHPAWSPDGSKIAFDSDRGGTAGIWVMNADGSSPRRLTGAIVGDYHPAWSPDGTRIAYASFTVGAYGSNVWIMNADGSGAAPLTAGYEEVQDITWSPNGKKIAFTSNYYYYNSDIVIVGLDGIAYTQPRHQNGGINPSWRP
jgi:Tol biopolymer transport system component